MKNAFAATLLVLGAGMAYACGGDDEAQPSPARDAGSDTGRDVSNDTSVMDAAPDRAETGPDVADTGPSCALPRRQCGSECVDVSVDDRHCGGCGKDCGPVAVCSDGICLAPCGVNQARCLGQCVALATDNVNCGRCGERCSDGLVCSGGACRLECVPPLATCPSASSPDAGSDAAADAGADATSDAVAPPVRRYCADFESDERNCGGCGVRCASGQECVQGGCDTSCVVGQTKCGASCHDLSTDLAHCGSCNNPCGAGEVCSGATCQASCGAPFERCGNRCANFASDPENCGDCGRACQPEHATAAICAAGRCGYVRCVQGFADCDANEENGCERPVSDDTQNCGFCGNRCQPVNATGPKCSGGSCDYTACAAGYSDCDGIRANGCETFVRGDVNNCGVCGKRCVTGELCSQSNCVGATSLTSFIFPGGIPNNPTRPRATQYTIATAPGATVFYTLNGSEPVPNAAGTTSGPSPLTLAAVDGTTEIRWFAQFPGGYRELVRSTVHNTNATATVNLGLISERTRLNGGGPIAVVARGGAVNGSVDYTVWSSSPSGYCPNCILQYVMIVDGVGGGPSGCADIGIPGAFPGVSGALSFSFTAPAQPGSYFIRATLTQQFSCDGSRPGGGEPLGMVVVQ
jgi:hypothetical protein